MSEDNTCNVDIELTLEEWGQIALIAHDRNETINETIVYILQKAMDSLEASILSQMDEVNLDSLEEAE